MKKIKKLLTLFMALVMTLSLFQVGVLAADSQEPARGFSEDGMYYTGKTITQKIPGDPETGAEPVTLEIPEAYPYFSVTFTDPTEENEAVTQNIVPALVDENGVCAREDVSDEVSAPVFASTAGSFARWMANNAPVDLSAITEPVEVSARWIPAAANGSKGINVLAEATNNRLSDYSWTLPLVLNSFAVFTSGDFETVKNSHQPGPFAIGGTAVLGEVNVGASGKGSYGLGSYFGGPVIPQKGSSIGNFEGTGGFIHVNDTAVQSISYSDNEYFNKWRYTFDGKEYLLEAPVTISSESGIKESIQKIMNSLSADAATGAAVITNVKDLPSGVTFNSDILTVPAGSNIDVTAILGQIKYFNFTGDIQNTRTTVTITSGGSITTNSLKYENENYIFDTVFGTTAYSGYFGGPMGLLWNFPNATSVSVPSNGYNGGGGTNFFGHILAPKATVDSTANIDGTVVAANIKAGNEIHLWTYPEGPSVQEGKLTLTKAISGATFDEAKTFTFNVVSVTDPAFSQTHTVTVPANASSGSVEITVPYGDYTISEETPGNIGNYTFSSKSPDVTVTVSATPQTATITNTYTEKEPLKASLTIQKNISGATFDKAQTFTFRLLQGDKVVIDNILLTVPAGGNQSAVVTIENLQPGTYVLRETAADMNVGSFTLAALAGDQTLTLAEGETLNATVTNTYTRAPGAFSVKKAVSGLSDADSAANAEKEYAFTVTAPAGVDLSKATVTGARNADVTSASITFGLGDGETATVANVPAGLSYTVTEEANSAAIDGYSWTAVSAKDISAVRTDMGLAVPELTIDNVYSKTPPKTGALTLEKKLAGAVFAEAQTFTFVVTGVTDTAFNETYTVTVPASAGSGSVEITVPYGEYTVSEETPGNIGDYTFVSKTADVTVTVAEAAAAAASITNTYRRPETPPPYFPPTDVNPPTDIPDEDPPLSELPETDIEDPEPPKADVPQTGDALALWATLLALSALGLLILIYPRKRRDGK